jgi:hypothetical protein
MRSAWIAAQCHAQYYPTMKKVMSEMDKGFITYMLIFLLLISAAVTLSSIDQITPTIAQAQAEMTIGTSTVQVVEKGMSLLLKLMLGAVVAGVAGAAYAEARKAYKTWQRNSMRRRWVSGPNAQWRGQKAPSMPKLTREDILLMALAGRTPADGLRPSPRRGMSRVQDDEEEVELEMPL